MSKVLLVEDDQAYSKALALHLRKRGHEPLVAYSAEEGMRVADQESGDIHVLVTDLRLPGEDGISLIRELQRAGRKWFVVLISAVLDNGIKFDDWEKLNIFDVISKEQPIQKVSQRIDAALDMHENQHHAMRLMHEIKTNGNNGRSRQAI